MFVEGPHLQGFVFFCSQGSQCFKASKFTMCTTFIDAQGDRKLLEIKSVTEGKGRGFQHLGGGEQSQGNVCYVPGVRMKFASQVGLRPGEK